MAATLIAGFGNSLRGDDGFGVEVIRRLAETDGHRDGVELLEVGTGGIRLAQQLTGGYDRLVVVDAMRGGGVPGTVYVRRVEAVERITEVDMHVAVPAKALAVALAMGVLPPEVYLVGCEPAEVDELRLELSPPVRAAVDAAMRRIDVLLREGVPAAAPGGSHGG